MRRLRKNCPVGNIKTDGNGKFSFGGDCVMCARCSFNCPTNAFDIGMLNGWKVNGRYSYKLPEKPEEDKHAWYCKRRTRDTSKRHKRKLPHQSFDCKKYGNMQNNIVK